MGIYNYCIWQYNKLKGRTLTTWGYRISILEMLRSKQLLFQEGLHESSPHQQFGLGHLMACHIYILTLPEVRNSQKIWTPPGMRPAAHAGLMDLSGKLQSYPDCVGFQEGVRLVAGNLKEAQSANEYHLCYVMISFPDTNLQSFTLGYRYDNQRNQEHEPCHSQWLILCLHFVRSHGTSSDSCGRLLTMILSLSEQESSSENAIEGLPSQYLHACYTCSSLAHDEVPGH